MRDSIPEKSAFGAPTHSKNGVARHAKRHDDIHVHVHIHEDVDDGEEAAEERPDEDHRAHARGRHDDRDGQEGAREDRNDEGKDGDGASDRRDTDVDGERGSKPRDSGEKKDGERRDTDVDGTPDRKPTRSDETRDRDSRDSGETRARDESDRDRDAKRDDRKSDEPKKRGEKDAPKDEKPEDKARKKKIGRYVIIGGIVVLLLCVAGLVLMTVLKHRAHSRQAKALHEEIDKGPLVMVSRVTVSPASREVVLTADVRSLFQTTLYAKIAGYVRDIRVDKGDHVKKGQVLGTIESPESDQALIAARSVSALREKLVVRARRLAPVVLSEQDLDNAQANVEEARANLASASAMQQYEVIRAPFDGVVTARYVDPGALMPAATGGTQSALPFVDLADPDTLRIDAYVGQDVATNVKLNDAVRIWQDARPGVEVHAAVTRTSGALDPRTRTMLVEAQIDNRPYGFLPGTYANMSIHTESSAKPVVPAEALLTRDGHDVVARVDNGHVHFVAVIIGLIDGKTAQIESGIKENDLVALSLPTEVAEGGAVQTKEKPPPKDAEKGAVRAGGKNEQSPH